MAHSKSARKRVRQDVERRDRNRYWRKRLRTQLKKMRGALETRDTARVNELLRPTLALVDHTKSAGHIHANTAARLKSRLTRQSNALSA